MDGSILLVITIPALFAIIAVAERFFPSKRGPRTLNRFSEFICFALVSSFYTLPAAYVVDRVTDSGALALITFIGLTIWADHHMNSNT